MTDPYRYIAIDFDATIAQYDKWLGKGRFGKPIHRVQLALEKIKEDPNIKIIINTTRLEVNLVKRYLNEYEIPYDYVNFSPLTDELDLHPCKVMAHCYVDDRNIAFDGEWTDELVERIKRFKTYYEKRREVENTVVGRR